MRPYKQIANEVILDDFILKKCFASSFLISAAVGLMRSNKHWCSYALKCSDILDSAALMVE